MQSKSEIMECLTENGVVAVVRKVPKEKVLKAAESLVEGGVNALEVTVDGDDAFRVIESLATEFQGSAVIGAGTVLDGLSTELAIRSGADFIVSPVLNEEVLKITLRHGKVSIPGVMTPNEMVHAIEYGADIVKVFPASVGGPGFLKDIKGPLPHIPIIPTGGVNLNNTTEYIKAGAIAIGAGGNLLDKKAILEEDFQKLRETAKEYVKKVKLARKEKK